VLQRLFRTYGLPDRIRSDNGPPFASTGLARLSTLAVWWVRLGIGPDLIAPGRPDQNGRHERMHRTLKAETMRPPAGSRPAQQRRFNAFVAEYNHERPHEALALEVPASCYAPSVRPWPHRLPPMLYPVDFMVRRVNHSGAFKWHTRAIFITEALGGEAIGLEPIDDGEWQVYFGPHRVGIFDEHVGRVRGETRSSHPATTGPV
jgi:putative transposase